MNFADGLALATNRLLELWELKPAPVVLIDGRAASGKSSFASELAEAIFREGEAAPKVIHMDDLYPGWEGLREGSNYLNRNILQPLAKGSSSAWQVWDWEKSSRGSVSEPGNGWREFSGGTILIIEGCASISKQTATLADLRIWIDCEPNERKARFSQRDKGLFDPYWASWSAQEDEFYEVEKSETLADFRITN